MIRAVHALLLQGVEIGHVVLCEQPCVDGLQQDEDAVLSGQPAGIGVRTVRSLFSLRVPGVQFLVHLAVAARVFQTAGDDEAAPQVLIDARYFHAAVRVAHVLIQIGVRAAVRALHAPGHLRIVLGQQLAMYERAKQHAGGQQDDAGCGRHSSPVSLLQEHAQEERNADRADTVDDQPRLYDEVLRAEELRAVFGVIQVRDGEKAAGQMADDGVDDADEAPENGDQRHRDAAPQIRQQAHDAGHPGSPAQRKAQSGVSGGGSCRGIGEFGAHQQV